MLIFSLDSQAGALTRSSFLQENPLRKRGLRLIYILNGPPMAEGA